LSHKGSSPSSNTIRIGNQELHTATFIAGITGVDEGSPTAVFINTTIGQLGTTPPASSQRFKKEIKPMDKASEGILALKPVTFQYKNDKTDTPQFGLIAEEVAKVNSDLVMRDKNGDIYSVRYDAVNAMLLNEFPKEHRRVEEQRAKIGSLNSKVARQEADCCSTKARVPRNNRTTGEQNSCADGDCGETSRANPKSERADRGEQSTAAGCGESLKSTSRDS
jgi:hypothetical protein